MYKRGGGCRAFTQLAHNEPGFLVLPNFKLSPSFALSCRPIALSRSSLSLQHAL